MYFNMELQIIDNIINHGYPLDYGRCFVMQEFGNERKTLIVIVLTLVTMVAEIVVGYYAHSMALFADGCHMGTHALALSITFFTYVLIRKFANSPSFVFGTGKFSTLSGFASSILLGVTGIYIIKEAIERFINPIAIELNEAIIVAIIGFVVNLLCIMIMGGQEHRCEEHAHEEDYNFKAAYMHILSDLMTSVFAIGALFAAKYIGWNFLDPIVGLIGGIIICVWAFGLIKSTGLILLDAEAVDLKSKIVEKLQQEADFKELHVWKTSEHGYSLIAKINTETDLSYIKEQLVNLAEFDSVTIEKN